jgi:hypothetical protein
LRRTVSAQLHKIGRVGEGGGEAADRVAAADASTWTTTYRLADGATARVVRSQTPSRVAYAWPSGSLISTPDAVTRCAGSGDQTVCTATSPDGDDAVPASTGLVTPAAILDMLQVAAIDPGVEVLPGRPRSPAATPRASNSAAVPGSRCA